MKKADAKQMKEINKGLLRNCFVRHVDETAGSLSKKTGLSIVTINALIREMLDDGEVLYSQQSLKSGGRPGAVYHYNCLYKCAVIIYGFQKNNKDHIQLIVADLLGNSVYRFENDFDSIDNHSFEAMLDKAFLKFPQINIIAFGLPGAEEDEEIIIHDYPSIVGREFIANYKQRYGVPVLYVNDVNAAVNGYYHYRQLQGNLKTVIGFLFPRKYMPGGGCVINGEIYTGVSNFAGEIGFMPLAIPWTQLDYGDLNMITDHIATLLATVSCIIAPECFVLYGDFWDDMSSKMIKEKAEAILHHKFHIQVVTSMAFERDFELGMIKAAIEKIEEISKE